MESFSIDMCTAYVVQDRVDNALLVIAGVYPHGEYNVVDESYSRAHVLTKVRWSQM